MPHSRPRRRALEGAIAGVGAPLGWMVIEAIRGIPPLVSLQADWLLYAYMLFGTVTVFAAFGHYVGRQESRLQAQSWHDHLTGLFNTRYYNERLDAELAAAARDKTPLSLICFDLDHFKRINDTYGHAAGDTVLAAISRQVGTVLRHNELFARVGGEEFAVMIPRAGLDHACRLASRILETARQLDIPIKGFDPVRVTLSAGAVEWQAGESRDALAARADAAMYRAKEGGRNRLVADTGISAETSRIAS